MFALLVSPVAMMALASVVVIVVAVRQHAVARRRQRLIQAFAACQGWQWLPSNPTLARRWRGKPFGIGGSRTVRNVVFGQHWGRPFTAFDYSYVVSSGKSSTRYDFTVVALRLPAVLPSLELDREGPLGGRVARALGAGDLQLENEEFNRMYRIRCRDDRYAMAVLHPRMMQLLLDTRVRWRIEGPDLLCWVAGHADPRLVLWYLDVMTWIAQLVPDFVVRDYGYPVVGQV
ncbi:MAG TPA: hypothetical protein VI076_07860 [Actinopolymorphaceae bacterium]